MPYFFFQEVGGINLLTDVPVKSRKPNLYATQLLSILFKDEELINGLSNREIQKARKKSWVRKK